MRKNVMALVTLLLLNLLANAQSPNDCANAINVCGNGIISSNAVGAGTQELSNSNSCQSQENNSLWLKIKIKDGGTLGFILTPTSSSITIDYDFFVFGPNVSCGNIGQAIRCSTTNPQAAGQSSNQTGMNGSNSDDSEGPGANGNGFVEWLTVQPNEEYFIVLDRPIGASSFDLEWIGSATFFEAPSAFDGNTLLAPQTPNSNTSEFDLSENNDPIINGQVDVDVSYYASLSDAIAQTNVLPNLYQGMDGQTIYARVTSQIDFGCFDISEFQLQIGIRFNCPNFFTPNGDGIHDYWNIPQQEFVSDIRIQIFDRYGKLLKVLKNSN
ncbi:MAG: T9SS type B sorting domain-containing protein, partial [Crocinitomicaceae bacterium]|nr:T9SS type B sorting domain-containing protein [Crocinitomicaceae bacterium]